MAAGKLKLLAITQEQHPERCALFAQWKGLDFPILHDAVNWTGARAVPMVWAIDEQGIVRSTKPTKDWVRETFVNQPLTSKPADRVRDETFLGPTAELAAREQAVARHPSRENYAALGDAAMFWSNDPHRAVTAYNAALQRGDEPSLHFRLGVALRRRHDSAARRPDDFARAANHWSAALAARPNQYIWRRRIQQYGPRLDKPYPFYDWVPKAQAELRAAGKKPVRLTVALTGAEVAQPKKQVEVQRGAVSPDPEGRIYRDEREFVRLNVAAVPARIRAGESVRLHLEFRVTEKAAWNNETAPLTVWVEGQDGWQPLQSLLRHATAPKAAESREDRRIEVEFTTAKSAKSTTLRGYALYFVCEKNGPCLYRRQDFAFHAKLREE